MAAKSTPPSSAPARVNAAVACAGVATGAVLSPPVFSALFAVSPLLEQEVAPAWVAAAALVVGFLALLVFRTHVPRPLAGLALALLAVVWIELAARAVVRGLLPPSVAEHLSWLANGTYPEFMIIKGHPFLHYVSHGEGNSLGFPTEREYVREKRAGVVRVACIGGSTTASKWPDTLEAYLNERAPAGAKKSARSRRFEVLDFGQNGYSSVHLLINFTLNVVDYSPDFVIIHSGWNDVVMRGKGTDLRSDYADVFKVFEYPRIRDRWAIRTSVIYRGLQYRLYREPAWANIRNALDIVSDVKVTFDDPRELIAFRRNIEKIIDLARARDIIVVLATQPRSTDPSVAHFDEATHIDQTNVVMRKIAAEHANGVFLVDLDTRMTGSFDEHFIDLGHLDDAGRRAKADALADAILAIRRNGR